MKNTTKTITIPETIDTKTLELFYAYAEKRGIKIEDTKTAEAKSEVKSAPKKKNTKNTFDRAKYESIAKKCGVYGRYGVWKSCRQYIYKVMSGEITEKKCAELCAEYANSQGWKLNK